MSEPNFPDAPLVHLSFDIRPRTEADPPSAHDTVAQCNFQHQDGTLTSFDPEQLPGYLSALMGDVAVKQAAALARKDAELAAKDANNAALVERVAELEADKTRLLLRLAEGSIAAPGGEPAKE